MWRTTTEGLSWDSPEKAERLWWVQIGSVLGVLGWAAEANVRQGPNRREVVVGLMEVVTAARMAGTVDAWEARLTDDGSPGDIVWRMTDGTEHGTRWISGPYGMAMEEERRRSVDNATLVELDLMAETVQQLQVDTGAGEWKAAVMAVEALESGALSAAVEAMLAMTPYDSEFLGQLLSVMGVRKAEGTGEWHGTDAGGGVRLLDKDATDEGGAAGK